MKILLATDTYYPSVNGLAYFTHRLATNLVARGHEVFVFAPSPSTKDTVTALDGVTVYAFRSLPAHLIYPNFRLTATVLIRESVLARLHDIQPDVVHIQSHFMVSRTTLAAAHAMGIPVVATNHFMPQNVLHYFPLSGFVPHKARNLMWRDFLRVFNRADAVTTPTRTAANLLSSVGFTGTVEPISCGIDLARFSPSNQGQYLRRRFNIPDSQSTLLYVGRLDKEKRVETILSALATIRQTRDAHLVLAGIGKERRRLEKRAQTLGLADHITFTGFVPDADLPNLYPIADLFVITSIAELQSIATMEAMASGLPVVAADAMALPELVRDGENGYLVRGDSNELAKKILAIVSNPKRRGAMGQASLRLIRQHAIDKTVDRYEAIYRQLVTGRCTIAAHQAIPA